MKSQVTRGLGAMGKRQLARVLRAYGTGKQVCPWHPGVAVPLHLILICALAALAVVGGCKKPQSKGNGKRVVVIGFDGMDPRVVERMMDDGRLPNFKKLEETGGFWKLGTAIPPQSPVAWSNFITGADPGAHGIFDFIHREPDEQADPSSPFFSANKEIAGDRPSIIFEHAIPMPWQKPSDIILTRGGTPFWEYLDSSGIPAQLYRLPANYPPTPGKNGHMCCLAGMGTPDITGSQGSFQWFSPDFDEPGTKNPPGGTTLPMAEVLDDEGNPTGAWLCRLRGTQNPIHIDWVVDPQTGDRVREQDGEYEFEFEMMDIELFIEPDREHDIARIRYTNAGLLGFDSQQELLLQVGQWSEWQPLVFSSCKLDPGGGFPAIARFWLKKLRPWPELYVTPINFDPVAPMARISEPADFVTKIGEGIGPFYTQGFAEDFKAFDAKVTSSFGDPMRLFDAEAYRIQSQIVMDERVKLLDFALKTYDDGLLFFYFSSTDLIGHIFWWNPEADGLDDGAEHPTRSAEDARKYHRVLEGVYEQCDVQLAKVIKAVGDEATLFVMSDHGFGPFQRKVNLNTWLYRNGYITTKPDGPNTGYLADIADWSQTKAYSIGLNGIYLNLAGRERDGSVQPDERDAILAEITKKLLAATDPKSGKPVVYKVYRTDEIYHGPYAPGGEKGDYTPDLIVGYHLGYITRSGTMGSITKNWLYNNRGEWSADHCIAAELVPGILFSNRKITISDPDLTDLAPTILAEFGVAKPDHMTGRNLLGRKVIQTASARE